LALLGAAGILFTFIIYRLLFYFGFIHKGGFYDKLKTQMAKTLLDELVKKLEYYKVENYYYPEILNDLVSDGSESDGFTFIYEPFIRFGDSKIHTFNYELFNEGSNYFLFSSGPDQLKGTLDDIFPQVSEDKLDRLGYRKYQSANQAGMETP